MKLREFLALPTYTPFAFLAIVCVVMALATYNLLASFLQDVLYPVLRVTIGVDPGGGNIILDDAGNIAWLGGIWTNLIALGVTWLVASRLFPRLWDRYLEATRECPYCLSDVDERAIRCSHCGSELPVEAS